MPPADMDPRIAPLLAAWFGPPAETQADLERLLERWFKADPATDRELARRFAETAESAARGELDAWRATAEGRLALILLLDQFPRQLHRGTAAAFAQDERALELALTGIERRMDLELGALERAFFYMPLQHAESLPIQELGVGKFAALAADAGTQTALRNVLGTFTESARAHRDIVARFGRFPHRNRYLDREDTPEEAAFERGGGPTFGQ